MSINTLFLTDIHGCYDEMIELIDRAKADKIIITGDLIDRGPHSEKVVQYVIDNNIECTLGNHELMAIECLTSILNNDKWELQESDWFYNGGKQVYNQYSSRQKLIEHIRYFNTLPIYIDTGLIHNSKKIIATHTNIFTVIDELPIESLSFWEKTPLVWGRGKTSKDEQHLVIHGHTPTNYYAGLDAMPYITDQSINLDTGCAYKQPGRGKLTGLIHPSMEVIQCG